MTFNFRKIALLCASALVAVGAYAAKTGEAVSDLNVVPYPRVVTVAKGADAVIGNKVNLVNAFKGNVAYEKEFATSFLKKMGIEAAVSEKSDKVTDKKAYTIELANCDTITNREAYLLSVSNKRISIKAKEAVGVFYALQTLRQLLFNNATKADDGTLTLKPIDIYDAPAFGYRGVLMDVSRHFFTVDEVKQVLNIMAMHKMNTMHLHLTDDQGWRIEIKAYPELTRVGSVRAETMTTRLPAKGFPIVTDGRSYGGFYTQDECRDMVRYAAERGITIIPEIEIPGHSVAALASYNWLGCRDNYKYQVRTWWGPSQELACPGKPTTFEFWHQVLKEVCDIFPSEYINIGGDECPKQEWKNCARCQAFMKEHNIPTEDELQGYITREIEGYLAKLGRKIIGWGELLDYNVSSSTTAMLWMPDQTTEKAAKNGNHVIVATNSYCYFDYYQSENHDTEPLSIGGYVPFEKVYSFDPLQNLPKKDHHLVTGVQANVWTEYINGLKHFEYMLLPRLAAMSEVGWTYGEKNLDAFKQRTLKLIDIYKADGYMYAPHIVLGLK